MTFMLTIKKLCIQKRQTPSIHGILPLLQLHHTQRSTMTYNDLQARLAKSKDNNKTYVTLRESTITKPQFINDPDDQ
eukprot:scaffold231723_cov58-Attheya_sp.AAC.2